MTRPASWKTYLLFLLYLCGLSAVILLKFNPATFRFVIPSASQSTGPNLELGRTVLLYLTAIKHDGLFSWGLVNLLGNVLLFLPYGLLAPRLYRGPLHLSLALASGALLSLAYELIQFKYGWGVFDVDDLLLNTVGVLLGVLLYLLLRLFGCFRAKQA